MKNPFDYHVPSSTQLEDIEKVRTGCKELYRILLSLKPSRERSLAITKLEEVGFWANKGVIAADERPVEVQHGIK